MKDITMENNIWHFKDFIPWVKAKASAFKERHFEGLTIWQGAQKVMFGAGIIALFLLTVHIIMAAYSHPEPSEEIAIPSMPPVVLDPATNADITDLQQQIDRLQAQVDYLAGQPEAPAGAPKTYRAPAAQPAPVAAPTSDARYPVTDLDRALSKFNQQLQDSK